MRCGTRCCRLRALPVKTANLWTRHSRAQLLFLAISYLNILIKSYPDQGQRELKDERPVCGEQRVPNQVSLVKASRWYSG